MHYGQQSSKYDNCDLQEKNLKVLREIQNEKSTAERILKIKEKIELDRVYKKAEMNFKIHGSSINLESKDSNVNLCGIKILFVLEYGKRKSIKLDLDSNPEYKIIVENLNENNVSIWILDSKVGSAIYGTSGSSGVIFLRTKNKELKRMINQTSRKNAAKQDIYKSVSEVFIEDFSE